MDNHRAAAWCWAQHLGSDQQFSIFHIDRHYDLLQARLDEWCSITPAMEALSIEDYLEIKYNPEGMGESPVIRWDNYFPIFIKQRERFLRRANFLTHCEGDKPCFLLVIKNSGMQTTTLLTGWTLMPLGLLMWIWTTFSRSKARTNIYKYFLMVSLSNSEWRYIKPIKLVT